MQKVKKISIFFLAVGVIACGSNQAPISNGALTGLDDNSNIKINSVFFDVDSDIVSKSYHKLLAINARYLISHPYSIVQIQGNSSEDGTPEHNQELGLARAKNVKQYLADSGVPDKQIQIISYGDTRPLFPKEAGKRQVKNQRADISYTSLPPYQYKVEKMPIINITTMY